MRNILVLIVLASLMFNGCKKHKDLDPVHPTNGKTTAVFNPNQVYGTLTDQDGNIYKTIKIGTQTWMAENLRVTHYRNGEAIPVVNEKATWMNLSSGAYCNNTITNNNDTIATYGRLYNWFSVNDARNLSPAGWHVASDTEWITLINYLDGGSPAALKLKEIGKKHWKSLYTNSNNSSGFTALPGGYCNDDRGLYHVGDYGFWWTSTPAYTSFALYREISLDDIESVFGLYNSKRMGLSVRCVKD